MITLIRHGQTLGNEQKRYIGSIDERLSENGAAGIARMNNAGLYPAVGKVLSSPMKRCLETAAIIYPDKKPAIIAGFREISFGEFEGLTFEEITGREGFEAFGGSPVDTVFPGGEPYELFEQRCENAFREVSNMEDIAVITHGGVIMTIMNSLFGHGGSDYYEFWVDNGRGYTITREDGLRYIKL